MAFPRPFGRYVLDSRIAMGGMAEIFRAHTNNEGFQKRVCIKCVLPHFLENESFVSMFRDEAALAARLQHGNIVQVFDFGTHDESLYLAMEFIDGADLKRVNLLAQQNGLELNVGQVLQIGIEVARGLHYAHTLDDDGRPLNIVHRDVSPHNILVSRQGEVKLTDFGIAKAAARATHTAAGIVKGKLAYMAPEQAEGGEIDQRVDEFALGVVLWETLTGARLFSGGSEAEILKKVLVNDIPSPLSERPDLPPEVAEVVMTLLARDPEQRFKDLRAVERAFTKLQYEVADDPNDCDLRPFMQSILEGSAPAVRRRTAMIPPSAVPRPAEENAEESEVLSLTEAGFDRVDQSAVFTSGESQKSAPAVIDFTQAASPSAKTELIEGHEVPQTLKTVVTGGPADETGVTSTIATEAAKLATLADDDDDKPEPTIRIRDNVDVPERPRSKVPLLAAALVGLIAAGVVGLVLAMNAEPKEDVVVSAVVEDVVAEEPIDKPVVADPVVADPVVADPVVADPVAADPVVADPVVDKPIENPIADPLPDRRRRRSTTRGAKKSAVTGKVYVDILGSWGTVYTGAKKRCDTPCTVTLPVGKQKIKIKTQSGERTTTVTVVEDKVTRAILK